ncbi:mariner Mos1 transposase [Elysia marginata]|uniref:Mariner Mos1 transposase n=1 Tax=Elysia marginata TaxID=1093978 RepID=A0AAV4HWY1_9GAST|nr:mariner Mos1 transposase [Elysia marginata]
MEFTKENMRFYIFMRGKLGESAKLILETLQTVCGDCACCYQSVCSWVKEFNEGKESLSDCPRPGRPKSCVNDRAIASIKKDIDEDHHISVRELSDTIGLSYGTVHTIITEHLRMKKVMKLGVLPHPAYSPDLAPCDFWLFPTLKDRLAGRKFDRIQDLAKAVNSELRAIPEEDVFRKCRSG